LHNIDKDAEFEHAQTGQFVVQVFDAVVHELRHQQQGRTRKFLLLPGPKDGTEFYLSDPDEIDAYAVSVAVELIRNLGRQRSIQYLHRASRLSKIRPKGLYASPTLLAYFDTFGDIGHPVIKKLLKKVFLNLEMIDKTAVFY